MECEGRRQGKGFICWQVKLRDTSSAGYLAAYGSGRCERFVCGNVEGVPTWRC